MEPCRMGGWEAGSRDSSREAMDWDRAAEADFWPEDADMEWKNRPKSERFSAGAVEGF